MGLAIPTLPTVDSPEKSRIMRSTSRIVCFSLTALLTLLGFAGTAGADLLPRAELEKLGARRYWDGKLQLRPNEMVSRVSLLDENLYIFTDQNRVFAVHALTGVLRWSRPLAEPGQTVRGPTHSPDFVLFSTPGDVRVVDRATGESKGEPRSIRGVIIDVQHDDAEVNVGQLHGLFGGETLMVHRGEGVRPDSIPLATLKITQVMPRYSKGRLTLTEQARHVQIGDNVRAELVLPLKAVRLPFAPSSAAVADDTRIFFGAANARFYCLEILTGFEHWVVRTPRTVTSTPVLVKDNLYYAGQDGLVVSCTKADRIKNWTFQTEGAIFADLEVTPKHVLVASSDRSLYCLDRETGGRAWRERMDMPLSAKPIAADKQVYQEVSDFGRYDMDVETGKIKWHRPEGGRYLMQSESTAFLWSGMPGEVGRLVAIEPETGKESGVISTMVFSFAAASRSDQAMVFVSRLGDLLCARPKSAEPLKPEQLAAVLKDDRAAKVYAKMGVDRKEAAKKRAEEAARVPERPARLGRYSYLMDDWLRSSRDRAIEEPSTQPADDAEKTDEESPTTAPADDEEAAPKDDEPAADEDADKKEDEKPEASSDDDDDDDGGDMENDKEEGGSSDDDDDDTGGG